MRKGSDDSAHAATGRLAPVVLLAALVLTAACSRDETTPPEVIVFTALDRVYSEPVLERFEAETGIRVRAKYDVEAAKTTGLVNQIIARRDDPECDVFWNNELLQTAHLGRLGLLEPYDSPSAARFDERYRDPRRRWTGFAARARVIIYNTDLVAPGTAPRRLQELTEPAWDGQVAVAMPFFGTTFTHMGMLRQAWGEATLEVWLRALLDNDVAIAAGNGPVRDLVATGERAVGLTDTDDAHGAILAGRPVRVLIPDAAEGAALIPNTVSLIAGCPHPDEGRALIDFLLSAQVERELALGRSAQIPLGRDLADLPTPWNALLDGAALPFDANAATTDRAGLVTLLRRAGFDR